MIWFVLENDEVKGPYTEHHIQNQFGSGVLVWSSLQDEWYDFDIWIYKKEELKNKVKKINTHKAIEWHYSQNGQNYGPYSKKGIIEKLRSLDDKNNLYLWNTGLSEWQSIYNFPDLLDSKETLRRHPRFNVREICSITPESSNETRICQIHSLGEGGFGAHGLGTEYHKNQIFNVKLDFLDTDTPVMCKAILRHVNDDEYSGFQFEQLNDEAKASLIDYLRRIENLDADDARAAA